MTAEQIFDAMRGRIDRGCQERDWRGAIEVCEAAGMPKVNTSNGYTLSYDLKVTDAGGDWVTLEFYSRDTSRPFQINPDVHDFHLQLWRDDQTVRSHGNRSYA